MTQRIRRWFDGVTMYRLAAGYLLALAAVAAVSYKAGGNGGIAGGIVAQSVVAVVAAVPVNFAVARAFGARPNPESAWITALIIALIVGPADINQPNQLIKVAVIAVAAMVSKYLIVWRGRHVFNPAAAAIMAGSVVGWGASWWIGSSGPWTWAATVIGGGLLVTKTARWSMVAGFMAAYLGLTALVNWSGATGATGTTDAIAALIVASPLLFFATVMLIEPLTSLPTRRGRLWFAVMIGVAAFGLNRLVPHYPHSLELSLVAFNFVAAVGRPADSQSRLKLRTLNHLSTNIVAVWFDAPKIPRHAAGQYFEWTLPHPQPDSRGVRRWFTIASSPTESGVLLVTKIAQKNGSSFKRALVQLTPGDEIAVTGPEGEFVLPRDEGKPLAFIAGGIGITPFRSMIQWLLDTGQKRDIVLIYGARVADELVFGDLFDRAKGDIGLKVIYVVSDGPAPAGMTAGRLTAQLIQRHIPDLTRRLVYISGPEAMVKSLSGDLVKTGIPKSSIKLDDFPGYGEGL